MCNDFIGQLRGWCKAFTRTEIYLSLVQAVLLGGLIGFLIFLTLHFIACSKRDMYPSEFSISSDDVEVSTQSPLITSNKGLSNEIPEVEASTQTTFMASHENVQNVKCTWKPSHPTIALTKYYFTYTKTLTSNVQNKKYMTHKDQKPKPKTEIIDIDGIPETDRKKLVLALVKIKPPLNLVFGCILTLVNRFWSITAASCIESIEEVDSLDSFVIMENFGQITQGPVHTISDINIHPLYQGTNKSYDLAVISSEDGINISYVAQLPKFLDYLLNNLGEDLNILGFGKFRSIDKSPLSREVRSVTINIVPLQRCESGDELWSLRHLIRGEAVPTSDCEIVGRPICAAVPKMGAGACNYCAGSPLFRDKTLLGIMSDNKYCGMSCEPNLYVNLAAMKDWLESIINLE